MCSSNVSAQDYVDECPEPNGFYADAVQCDRYYECKDSVISDKLCPDGLVFDETSIQFAKCSFPFSVSCEGREELQKAKPGQQCPRQNGYFVHEDPTVCDKFYFCVDGVANQLTCPESLIFNPANGQCAYSDQVKREGCSSSEFFQFKCPNDPTNAHAHPRYADPTSCQYFFLCLDGKDARRNGCQTGLVFNPKTSSCDRQDNLDATDPCRNYYNETTLEDLRNGNSQSGRLPPGVKNNGNGIKLDTRNRQRVAVVRRKQKRPVQQQLDVQSPAPVQQGGRRRPAASQAGISGSVAGSAVSGSRRRVPADPRVRAQQSSNNLQTQLNLQAGTDRRTRIPPRTRVRNPNLPGFPSQQKPVEEAGPPGPPQFALDDDEAIQKFRDSLSSRFAPQSSTRDRTRGSTGGSRLTVLSSRRRNPQPELVPQDDPKSELGSFAAVPDTQSDFGNRFRSRRPPTFQDSNTGSQEVKSLPVRRTQSSNSERIQQVDFAEDDGEFGSFLNSFDRRTRNPTPEEIKSLPVRAKGDRLEVTKIEVQPQFDLAEAVREQLDRQEGGSADAGSQLTSFPAFESGRQRQSQG